MISNQKCAWDEYCDKKDEWKNNKKKLKEILFASVEKKCVECGSGNNLTADHIRPLRKDGINEVGNLQIMCFECNRRKGAR